MRNLSFALILGLAAGASAQKPMDLAKKIVEDERKANLANDVAWFDKHQVAEYVEIGKDGRKKTKAESLAQMKAMSKQLKIKSIAAKPTSAKTVGKDLVIDLEVHIVGSLMGPDGKAHAFDYRETSEETWTKVGVVWKEKLGKTLTEGGKIDGKSVGA